MVKRTTNACIRGIASSVPDHKVPNSYFYERFGETSVEKISRLTGVLNRYHTTEEQCTSDLCYLSAKNLMSQLKWDPETIDGIIFISQTPDFILPATACILQTKLGLREDVFAFDVNLGCSGYVYGLWLAFSLVGSTTRRIILCAGDTISKVVSPEDRSTVLLFGDGGSATAVEYIEKVTESFFSLHSDGTGFQSIIIPTGAFRNSIINEAGQKNILTSTSNLLMDGTEVFNFTISKIPETIKTLMDESGFSLEQINYFVPHQANLFMLNHIANKIGFPVEKMLISIDEYGNTSSSSIPISFSHGFKEKNLNGWALLAGFGVGLSWGIALLNLNNVYCLPVKKSNSLMPKECNPQ